MIKLAFEFINGYTSDKNTQVKLFTVLFNLFRRDEWYRYCVFSQLLDYWDENDCAVVIKKNLQIIDELSKHWNITIEERINLYKKAVDLFFKLDEHLSAYELMHITIGLFDEDKKLIEENRDFVTRTITLALQHPKIAQFEDLYNLPAVRVQREEKKDEKLLELLHIFTYENLEEYNKWESVNKKYLEQYNIDTQVCKNKIMYLSFCSQAMKDRKISYDSLSKIVGISRDEIEDWIVDAIVNEIIDARLDQENEQIVINSFKQRTTNLKERLAKATEAFSAVMDYIKPKN